MSEEELGEGSLGLRARGGGGAVDHGQVLVGGSEERGEEEEVLEEEEAPKEDEVQASLLQLLDQDLLACDVQLSLFVAAASSYRQDTTLRPFPPFFITSNGERDVEGLQAAITSLPSLEDVRRGLNQNSLLLSVRLLKLLLWVFGGGLRLRCLSKTEAEEVLSLPGRDSSTSKSTSSHSQPQVVLEVLGPGLSNWEERVARESNLWAFHGSRLDNFHSILNFGLQQHRNKVSLFGEGIYLARDLGVCLAYSHRGQTWQKSALGNSISALAVAQVLDHPTQVNLHSADARGEVEGSEGGRLPDMYVVVRNNELLKIRYIMIYRHETSALRAGRGIIAAWIGRNRLILLLLAYAAMLALIGLANSQWVKRWLRRNGFSS